MEQDSARIEPKDGTVESRFGRGRIAVVRGGCAWVFMGLFTTTTFLFEEEDLFLHCLINRVSFPFNRSQYEKEMI